jgi:hypothetical protein
MEHLQYHHFPSRAQEGAEAVVLPAEGRDRIGCFADQVKLTHALVRDLDNAMKRSNGLATLEDHRGWGLTQATYQCRWEANEGEAKLEGIIQSRDQLIMKMADEYGLNHMGEDYNDDDDCHTWF